MAFRTMFLALMVASQTFVASAELPAGHHDFDFQFGTWRVHVLRLEHPATGAATWVKYDGTHVVAKVWGGRANLGVLEIDGPAGHIEGQSLRMYDQQTRQWSFTFAESSAGVLGMPMSGEFKNGRGVFYAQGTRDGRVVFERSVTSDITANAYRDEYGFSSDGGKTWQPDWIAIYTRTSTSAAPAPSTTPIAGDAHAHDFDFNIGTWRTHIRFLEEPANGPPVWSRLEGTVTVHKIWGGRASMEEIEADGATGHFEGLTMFLYKPQTHEWSQTFAAGSDGTFTASMIGAFANGRGELVSQDQYQGKAALIRGVWSHITPNAHHFEEDISRDAGETWHPHFIANLTRLR